MRPAWYATWWGWLRPRLKRFSRGPVAPAIRRSLKTLLLEYHVVYGHDPSRLHLAPSSVVNNALFNTVSGHITVGDYVFFGFNVCILTGTHDYRRTNPSRQEAVLDAVNDIVIEPGAWLATNVTVIGPCKIGEWSVVAAGSVVTSDVPPYTVVAGVPARVIKTIPQEKDDPAGTMSSAI